MVAQATTDTKKNLSSNPTKGYKQQKSLKINEEEAGNGLQLEVGQVFVIFVSFHSSSTFLR